MKPEGFEEWFIPQKEEAEDNESFVAWTDEMCEACYRAGMLKAAEVCMEDQLLLSKGCAAKIRKAAGEDQ